MTNRFLRRVAVRPRNELLEQMRARRLKAIADAVERARRNAGVRDGLQRARDELESLGEEPDT